MSNVDYTRGYDAGNKFYQLSFFGMAPSEALPDNRKKNAGYDNRYNIDEGGRIHPSWYALRLDIRDRISELIKERGNVEFHVNLDRGSDFIFAEEVAKIKKQYPQNVRLIAHAVTKNYSDKWGKSAKKKLYDLQGQIDEVVLADDIYSHGAVAKNRRNMLRQADEVLFFWNGIDTSVTQTSQAVIDSYNQKIKTTSMGAILLRDKLGNKSNRLAFPTDGWLLENSIENITNEAGRKYRAAIRNKSNTPIITEKMFEEVNRQNEYGKYSESLDDKLSPYMSKSNREVFVRGHRKLFGDFDNDRNLEKTLQLIKALNRMGISYEVQEPNLKNGSISLSLSDGSNGWLVVSQSSENQKYRFYEYHIGSYSTALERYSSPGVKEGMFRKISALLRNQGVDTRKLLEENGLSKVPNENSPGYDRYLRQREKIMYDSLNDNNKMLLVALPVLYGTGRTIDALGIDGMKFVQEKDAKNISTKIALVIGEENNSTIVDSAINFIQKDPEIKNKYGDRSNLDGTKQYENLADVLGFNADERKQGAAEKFIANSLQTARENYIYALINGEDRSEQFDEIHEKYEKFFKEFDVEGHEVDSSSESIFLVEQRDRIRKAMTVGLSHYAKSFNENNVNVADGKVEFSGDPEGEVQTALNKMNAELDTLMNEISNDETLINDYSSEIRIAINKYFEEQIVAMNGFLGDGYNSFNIPNMAMLQDSEDTAKSEKVITNAFIQSRVKDMAVATGDWNKRKIASRLLQFDRESSISYSQIKQLRAFDSTRNLDIDANGHAEIDGKVYDLKKYPAIVETDNFDANSARSLKNLEYVFDKMSEELKNSYIYPNDRNVNQAENNELSDIRIDKNGLVNWSGYRSYRYNTDSKGNYVLKTAPISGTIGQVFVQDRRQLLHVEEAGHNQGENLTFVPSLVGYLVDPEDGKMNSLAKLTKVKQYNEYLTENIIATLRKQLSRGTAMDVSRLEETFSVNSLYHGQEDILEPIKKEFLIPNDNKSQKYIDAVLQTLAVRVKFPKFLGEELGIGGMYNSHVKVLDKTKYTIEKDYLESMLKYSAKEGVSLDEIGPEQRIKFKREAMNKFWVLEIDDKNELVGDYFTNHGGVSIRDIAHESNKGVFSQDFSGNGSSLGRQRYIGSLDQIKDNGHIDVVTSDGKPIRIKTPIEEMFPNLFEDFEKSPSDRKIPFSKQILEASGITEQTKVMMMDISGLTDEDACVITKEYAERAAHPIDWEEEKKSHKLMFTDSIGKDRPIEDYLGMNVSLTSGSESRVFMLTVLNDSGIPMKVDDISEDFNIRQENVRLAELKKDGTFFKPSNRSLKSLSAGDEYIFDGIGKSTVVEVQGDGRMIRSEAERLKAVPVKVGDKLTELSGNKMTVSKIVDVDKDISELAKKDDFKSKQEARIIAAFKTSGAEISVNPYTPLSRKNAAQLAQLSRNYSGDGETVKFVDPVTGKMIDTGAQVSKMNIVLTNKQASKGSTTKGRKYSQQLAWADLERGGDAIVSEVFKDNNKNFEEFKEHALLAGYAIDNNGEVQFADLVDNSQDLKISVGQLINRDVNESDFRKTPLYRLVLAYGFGNGHDTIRCTPKKKRSYFMKDNKLDTLLGAKSAFKDIFRNRDGFLVLPTKVKLYSNVETDQIRIVPPNMRKARENQDKRIISSEYMKRYEEIVVQSARYKFYETVLSLVNSYDPNVLFTNYQNDGKSATNLRDDYIQEVTKRLDSTKDRLQAVVTKMSEIAAVKKIGKSAYDIKSGAIRSKLNAKQMKQGVTAVMANGSVDCALNEIHIASNLANNFKGMVADKEGYLHIKREVPKNITLDDEGNLVVSGKLPKGYELVDQEFIRDAQGHLIDVSYGGDVQKALVHFHRDPVWHSTGTIATYAKVRKDIDGVLVNAAIVGMLDGDFDGDNAGVIPLYTDEAQNALETSLALENNLINIGSDEKNPTLNIALTGGIIRGAINSGYIDGLPEEERRDSEGNALNPKKALENHVTRMVVQGGKETVNGKEYDLIGYMNEKNFTTKDVSLSRKKSLEFIQELYGSLLENSFDNAGIRIDKLENSVSDLKKAIDLGLKGKDDDLASFVSYATGKKFEAGSAVQSERLAEKFVSSGYSSEQLKVIQNNGVAYIGKDFDYNEADSKVNIANAAKSENTGIPGQKEQEMVSALKGKGGLKEALEVMYPIMQANLQVKHNADDALKMTEAFRNQLQSLMEGKDSNPRVIFDKLKYDPFDRLKEQTKFAVTEYNKEFLESDIEYLENGKFEKREVKQFKEAKYYKMKGYEEKYPRYYGENNIPKDILTAKTFVDKFKYIMDKCNVSVDGSLLERMAVYLSNEDPNLTDKSLDQLKIEPVKEIIQRDTPALEFANSKGVDALRTMALSNFQNNKGNTQPIEKYLDKNEKLDMKRTEGVNSFYSDKVDKNLQSAKQFSDRQTPMLTKKENLVAVPKEIQDVAQTVSETMLKFRKSIDMSDDKNLERYGLSLQGIKNATYRVLSKPIDEIKDNVSKKVEISDDELPKKVENLLSNAGFIGEVVRKYNQDIDKDKELESSPILSKKILEESKQPISNNDIVWAEKQSVDNSQIKNFKDLYDFVRKERDVQNPVRKTIVENMGLKCKIAQVTQPIRNAHRENKLREATSIEAGIEM